VLDQQVGHDHPQVGREEPPLLLLDVEPVLDRLDDRRVRARTPDILLLERLDQRGLGVPGRRLGEVLGRLQRVKVERLARVATEKAERRSGVAGKKAKPEADKLTSEMKKKL